jgi:hypothetical protein
MALEPLDFSQPSNRLSKIAEQQRSILFPRNDFVQFKNEYNATNPDALADGDEMGRGTGTFLDVYNEKAGTSIDVTERKLEVKINKYSPANPYKVVD